MAHALWHIEPSFIRDYWKDKVMGGAMAAQENVMNPLLDRVVGTAPGIPPRPFFGGETSGGRPAQPTTPTKRGPLTLYESVYGSAKALGRRLSDKYGGSEAERSLLNQGPIPKGTPGVGDKPIAWRWEPNEDGVLRLVPDPTRKPPVRSQPPVPVSVNPSQFPGGNQRLGYGAGRAASGSYGEAGRSHMGHQTVRRAGQKTTGPLKGPIKEASTPEPDDDKLARALKMMFLADLIRGTEAPNPDYYSAVSVGPASRAFAPLPSMFRGR